MGGDVPRTSKHDIEHHATLVVAGLGVRIAIYGLEFPFGLLEPQSVILVLLGVFLLLALLLAGRRTIIVLLLQLLAVLFHEFLRFPALLSDMVHRVVHWATRASIITARRLMGVLVTSGSSAPIRCSSSSYGGGSSSQWLVIAVGRLLFLVLVLAATSLGSSTLFGLGTLPHLWSRRGVPGMTLYGPGTLVHQAEELCDILDVMRGELLQHLHIPHTLMKCNHNRSIGDMRIGVANLGKPLNKGA
jgi:uncharacterized membrane protein (Fun14 family)